MKTSNSIKPPRWADHLLSAFCSKRVMETLKGDMYELYAMRYEAKGKLHADLGYLKDIISAFRPFAIRKIFRSNNSNYINMYRSYLLIAWRNLAKHKTYTFIKVGGFSIGIALCFLIGLFVQDEMKVDRDLPNGKNLFRVVYKSVDPAQSWMGTSFPAEAAPALQRSIPEIEKAGRLIAFDGWFNAGSNLFRPKDQNTNIYETRFAYMDQELLEMLSIKMVHGSNTNALAKPFSMVISKRKADKYFPNQNPVGNVVFLNDDTENPYVVGGVMENPNNSHLEDFDFFITLSGVEFWPGEQTNWCCYNYSPYVQIRDGASAAEVEEKIQLIKTDYIVKYQRDIGNQSADNTDKYHSLVLQSVPDIYLYSQDIHGGLQLGDIAIVRLFIAVGVFILLLACINFINLATAKSANRAREVGLRKTIGSKRSDLIQQFFTESLMLCAISVIIGAILAWLAMPVFNLISGKDLSFPYDEIILIPILALLILVIGLISGLYPALYLSKFEPIAVLRGKLSLGSKSGLLRGGLVVFQFSTSVILIVGALVVAQQIDYILDKKLGYDKDHTLLIHGANTLGENIPTFKQELLKISGVRYAAASSYLPVEGTRRNGNQFYREGRDKIDKGVPGQFWQVDTDYIETLGLKVLDGRIFDPDIASDTAAVMVNEAFVRNMGLTDPVGTRIFNFRPWIIVGVVEDFHFDNLTEKISPLVMVRNSFGDIITINFETENPKTVLSQVNELWDRFQPNQPMRHTFMADNYERMYDNVKRTSNLFTAFAVFGSLVACLGLFGLSAFLVEQRSKEISIRKVLGASMNVIFYLLTRNFLVLIMLSLVFAIPISWLMMDEWLADFEYGITLSWPIFTLAGIIVFLIAILTISRESIKAALVNPATRLRSE